MGTEVPQSPLDTAHLLSSFPGPSLQSALCTQLSFLVEAWSPWTENIN